MLLSIFSSRVKSEFTLMEIATAQPTVDRIHSAWSCIGTQDIHGGQIMFCPLVQKTLRTAGAAAAAVNNH